MKSISIICMLLLTTTISIVAAASADKTLMFDWTSNPILLQTVGCATGTDGCRIFGYNKPKDAVQSFGFALLPASCASYEGKTFADIISNQETMYFSVEHNTELLTETRATTVAAYSQLHGYRFMLLCAHALRRDHIQQELEKNAHTFADIADVQNFLNIRLPDSTYVVWDVDAYTKHIMRQSVTGEKLQTISSPREVAAVQVIAGRSMSF